MHPVANEVDVPTEAIEKALRRYLVPGFTGDGRVSIRVRPEAALEVEMTPEITETQGREPSRCVTPSFAEAFEGRREDTLGQLDLRRKLAENSHRFRLGMRVREVRVHIKDGRLNRFDLVTVG